MTILGNPLEPIASAPRYSEEIRSQTSPGPRPIKMVYEDPTTEETMQLTDVSGVMNFWDDPAEDIYSMDDGDPV